jgi:hypothetical protein
MSHDRVSTYKSLSRWHTSCQVTSGSNAANGPVCFKVWRTLAYPFLIVVSSELTPPTCSASIHHRSYVSPMNSPFALHHSRLRVAASPPPPKLTMPSCLGTGPGGPRSPPESGLHRQAAGCPSWSHRRASFPLALTDLSCVRRPSTIYPCARPSLRLSPPPVMLPHSGEDTPSPLPHLFAHSQSV